jgi:DNA-binding transcriptional regulator YiaG
MKDQEFTKFINDSLARELVSEDEFCHKMNISRTTLSRWKQGKSRPHPESESIVISFLCGEMFDSEITALLNQSLNFGLLSEEQIKSEFMISDESLKFWRHGECLPQGSFRVNLIKILRENKEKIDQQVDQLFVRTVKDLRTLVSDEDICQHFQIPSSTLEAWSQGANLPDAFTRGRVCVCILIGKIWANERRGFHPTDQ